MNTSLMTTDHNTATPHIRLNMIVKNEANAILRCLESVKPYIDSWVIVDTGSTDGTQTIIQYYMQAIPGQLFERPWKNFGHNRTEALHLALTDTLPHADYLLFIDADETLIIDHGVSLGNLNELAYYFTFLHGSLSYQRNALVSTKLNWYWKGVLHEYLDSPTPHQWHQISGIYVISRHAEGARGKDPKTYLKDIELLKQGLNDEPDNLRYQFYLAQSYRDAELFELAYQTYHQRAQSGGWEEERWVAQLWAARMAQRLNFPAEQVFTAYLQTWIVRQQRAEPLYELARYYRLNKMYDLACYFAMQAIAIPQPDDILFVEADVYQWRALDELSVSATYCPVYKEAGYKAMLKLIEQQKFPDSHKNRIIENSRLYFKS
ncbi:tetratricopeptide repeat-containing glycosyltransferase [Acinetobacter junii]|uniref:tetratricopeptide repeat-containing glycosyltransferase n=1 Tax=Acinetobacter junii TaxID=40215 RepID=UPI003AF90D67